MLTVVEFLEEASVFLDEAIKLVPDNESNDIYFKMKKIKEDLDSLIGEIQ